ncbi:MAG: hypothetical protein ACE5KT_02370 [Methanosarcinales archaeon]
MEEAGFNMAKRMIEETKDFIDKYNFNRYTETPLPHVSVRLKFKNSKKEDGLIAAKTVAHELKDEGLVECYCDQPYSETPMVMAASELASKCALIIKEKVEEYPQTTFIYNKYKHEFVARFLSNFISNFGVSEYSPSPANNELQRKVNEISALCTSKVKNEINEVQDFVQRDFISFNERFIHLFLNCLGFSYMDERNLFFMSLLWALLKLST